MLGKKGSTSAIENSALTSSEANASRATMNQWKPEDKPRVWCDYYYKPCYTKKDCWKTSKLEEQQIERQTKSWVSIYQ